MKGLIGRIGGAISRLFCAEGGDDSSPPGMGSLQGEEVDAEWEEADTEIPTTRAPAVAAEPAPATEQVASDPAAEPVEEESVPELELDLDMGLPLDGDEIGSGITALVVDGMEHLVTSWRHAIQVAARLHLEARGTLPETGYTARQRSPYAYKGEAAKKSFDAIGDDWFMKTRFNPRLSATVTLHLLSGAGHDQASCGYRAD